MQVFSDKEYPTPSIDILGVGFEGVLCQSEEKVLNDGYGYNNMGEW